MKHSYVFEIKKKIVMEGLKEEIGSNDEKNMASNGRREMRNYFMEFHISEA